MNFKKILSVTTAAALSLSVTALTASAESIGSASIYLADETWSTQVYWGEGLNGKNTVGIAAVTPVEITGDGTYTTSVEFTEEMNYGQVFCLNSDIKGTGDSSFADYPNAEMSIVSVKADGKEVQGNASVQDVNDNGFMKINIFDPMVDASENYVYKSDWTSGIKSVEVTFTVTGTGILPEEDTSSVDAEGTETPDEGTGADVGANAGESTEADSENIGGSIAEGAEDKTDSADEGTETPSDEKQETSSVAAAPVSVIFTLNPEDAVLTVYAVSLAASQDVEPLEPATSDLPGDGDARSPQAGETPETPEIPSTITPIPALADGTYALLPGEYAYTAAAEGYVSLENIPFTVAESDEALYLSVMLEPVPQALPFEQSRSVNGVVVTVKASSNCVYARR